MKKLITISLFIFWAVVVSILTAGLVFYQNNKNTNNQLAGSNFLAGAPISVNGLPVNLSNTSESQVAVNQNQASSLSLEEIAKHNNTSDCWLLINNNIYNVTSFLSAHPGGAGTIIPYCGKEATQAFKTKDVGQPHSSSAASMLADYYIGTLNQKVNSIAQVSNSKTGAGTKINPVANQIVNAPVDPTTNTQTISVALNMAEIAKHNSSNDCWLLINNKVYNVTSFIAAHPGGSGTIIPNCGKDSTQAYNTKGGNSPHSTNANAMLASYFIGNFNQQTSQQQIQQNVQNTNTVTPPTRGEEEDDD